MTPDERNAMLDALDNDITNANQTDYLFDVWMERLMLYVIAPVFVFVMIVWMFG